MCLVAVVGVCYVNNQSPLPTSTHHPPERRREEEEEKEKREERDTDNRNKTNRYVCSLLAAVVYINDAFPGIDAASGELFHQQHEARKLEMFNKKRERKNVRFFSFYFFL